MKTCSICGHQFPDDLKECPVCGTPAPNADNNDKETPEDNSAETPNGPTPPPVPDDIPPIPDAEDSPKTRVNTSAAVPPSGQGTVPPSGQGTVPPTGSAGEPPRRNNTVLWVVIGILSAISIIGATWFIATKVMGDDSKSSDSDSTSLGDDVEVVDYDTDNTPSQSEEADVDTFVAEPDYMGSDDSYSGDESSSSSSSSSSNSSSSSSSSSHANVITGNLSLNGQNKTCYVKLSFDMSGTASFNNTTVNITGNYYPGSHKLLIYEDGGGRYEGYVNGGTYSGTYHDDAGTWSFNMNVH